MKTKKVLLLWLSLATVCLTKAGNNDIKIHGAANSSAYASQIAKANAGQDSPYATIGGINSGLIEKEILLNAGKLECSDKNCKIVSFTLTINENGNLIERRSKNDSLTDDMKKNINELELESKIYFENIKALSCNGEIITLGAIYLKIIN